MEIEVLIQKSFERGIEALKILMNKRKAELNPAKERILKDFFISFSQNPSIESKLSSKNYSELKNLFNWFEGIEIFNSNISTLIELKIKPVAIVLINVISTNPKCPYCDFWIQTPEHARILKASMPVIELNYDWNPSPNPITLSLMGLCKDYIDLYYPLVIFLTATKGYCCFEILSGKKPEIGINLKLKTYLETIGIQVK